jgi:hypothetical protein
MRFFYSRSMLYLLSGRRVKRGDYVVSVKGYNVGGGCMRGTVTMDGFKDDDIGIDKAVRVKRSCFRSVICCVHLVDFIVASIVSVVLLFIGIAIYLY